MAQLAIAWVLAQGRAPGDIEHGGIEHGDIGALVGAKRPQRIAEAVGVVGLELTGDDLAAIDQAVPRAAVAGTGAPPRCSQGKNARLGSGYFSIRLKAADIREFIIRWFRKFTALACKAIEQSRILRLASLSPLHLRKD